MAHTTSWAFPNLLDVTTNRTNIVTDGKSVVNRTKLLLLTEPTELYNELDQGVGLKRYLWQYNTKNVRAIIQDKIRAQLDLHEPCVDAEETKFADALITAEQADIEYTADSANELNMTVGLSLVFSNDSPSISLGSDDVFSNTPWEVRNEF